MAWTSPFDFQVGTVSVATSENCGHPPEFWAEQIVRQLIFVADQAPEPIRAQAQAFREQMAVIVLHGIKHAIASDRAYRK